MVREMERGTNGWIVKNEDSVNVMYCKAPAICKALKVYLDIFSD